MPYTDIDTCIGSEWRFDGDKLKSLYGTVEIYRREAGRALRVQMDQRFLLPADAEILRRESVETVAF